jgi:hypothetical protein
MDFDKKHYDSEGPLGIPVRDAQAAMLDTLLMALRAEGRQPVRLVTAKAPTEVMDGECADVSWISTEEQGRENEIIVWRRDPQPTVRDDGVEGPGIGHRRVVCQAQEEAENRRRLRRF